MKYIIKTKDDKVMVEAVDKDHAFAKYFYDIINEKVSLDKIGAIILLEGKRKDGGDDVPFRTAPLLWKMGIIGTSCAIDNIVDCVGVSRKEAKKMLKDASEQDGHLIPLIEELRLAEGEEDTLVDGMSRGMQK